MPQQVARRQQIVHRMDKARRRPETRRGDRARHRGQIGARLDRRQQRRDRRLALAAHDALDGALAVLDQRVGDKRGAVPADADHRPRVEGLYRLGEVDDLGDVWRGSCTRRGSRPGASAAPSREGLVALDLHVDQHGFMPALRTARRDQLQPSGSSRRKIREYINGPG